MKLEKELEKLFTDNPVLADHAKVCLVEFRQMEPQIGTLEGLDEYDTHQYLLGKHQSQGVVHETLLPPGNDVRKTVVPVMSMEMLVRNWCILIQDPGVRRNSDMPKTTSGQTHWALGRILDFTQGVRDEYGDDYLDGFFKDPTSDE